MIMPMRFKLACRSFALAAAAAAVALPGCRKDSAQERPEQVVIAPSDDAPTSPETELAPEVVDVATRPADDATATPELTTPAGEASVEATTGPAATPKVVATTRPASEVAEDLESFDFVWQTVGERYYDPEMRGVDWEAARQELRPQVEAAGSRAEARAIMQGLLNRLGESHLVIIPAEGYDALEAVAEAGQTDGATDDNGPGETGLLVRATKLDEGYAVVVVDVLDGSPAAAAGVEPGALIESVDGRSLPELLAKAEAGMPDSLRDSPMRTMFMNEAAQQAVDGGGQSRGTTATLSVDTGGAEPAEVELDRGEPAGTVTQFGNLPPVRVRTEVSRVDFGTSEAVYASFSNFLDPVRVMGTLRDAVRQARDDAEVDGFILDLRGNSGGMVTMGQGVAGLFVNGKDHTLGTMTQRQMTLRNVIFPQQGFEKPLAILVDESSASMSEIFAGGMQDISAAGGAKVRVFGRNTAGAALPAAPARLPNGDGMIFVIADHVLPGGRRLEGVGVKPDVEVPLDTAAVEAYRTGTDPVVEAAAEWIASRP